jgi:hypothetical protein
MPVEAQDAAERLEPPRIGQAPQHILRPEVLDDCKRDLATERHHALEEPRRRFAAVQARVRDAGPGHTVILEHMVAN